MTAISEGTHAAPAAATRRTPGAIAIWLWGLAALVFLMVVLGGATRLTESGLSITQWKPLTGIVPPLSPADWQAEFGNYRKIPQYAHAFPDMTLSGFKTIFFFEWSHRLLGRLIGLAAALPMIWFWARGALAPSLKPKLLGLLALGALQGAVGWWMVKSGLVDRTEVAQERLAVHLLLASVVFAWIVWLAAGATWGESGRRAAPRRLRVLAALVLGAVFVQIGLGALVAGLRAGRAYNTWPLMEGRLIPPLEQLTLLQPLWRNFVDNILTVQLQHRLGAYALLALALVQALAALRPARRGAGALLVLILAQAALGVGTLLLAAPLWAALAHQALAMIVLAAATLYAQRLNLS